MAAHAFASYHFARSPQKQRRADGRRVDVEQVVGVKGSMSRRKFLQGLGVSAALSPLLPLLNASGQEALAPKRLILFYTPHSQYLPAWTPVGTVNDFVLGPALQPLAKHQAKLNVLAGVGMKGSFHQVGMAQLWTGSLVTTSDGSEPSQFPPNTSVDQVVAQSLGGITAYPSLEFGSWCNVPWMGSRMIFNNGVPREPQQDPNAAYSQLFTQQSAQTLRDNASVLDAVSGELAALQSRLSSADRSKIDAHLTSVRALETRLQGQAAACRGPNLANLSPSTLDLTSSDLIAVMTSALACDLTRVASFQHVQSGNDGNTYPWLNVNFGHHQLTHTAPSDTLDPNGNPTADQSMSVNGQLTRIYTWYAQIFCGLLDQLDAVPEGAGTMLDNSLVVWGSELAHCYTHMCGPGIPLVTAGGLGGSVRTGRFLDYSQAPQDHNRLLTTICNLMGLPSTTTFGTTDYGTGPLVGF